jgi:class 3 adenylate cyclase
VEVLNRMAQGHSRQKIAGDLVLGEETVASHVRSIFSKIHVSDEAAATAYAVQHGLTSSAQGSLGRPARASAAPARPLRIILVSDVVASADMIQRAGDTKAHDLIRTHNMLLRQCLATYQGAEILHTGDGVEASFTSASSAVECAVAIQKTFARHNREQGGEPIRLRIGINAGEPIRTEGRLFGAAVHAAFRICARAQPGQILISEVVQQLVASRGFTLVNRGRVDLKGLGRVRLYEVAWQPD